MENQSPAENNRGEHHGARRGDELQEIVSLQEFSQLLDSQPKKWKSLQHPQIHKVPPQLRPIREEQREHIYDPMVVSLGPYHHGKTELRQVEEFKYICLDWCAGGDEERKGLFYNKILEEIAAIRDCYAEVTIVEKYDDKALALMMLLDSCFIVNFMHNSLSMEKHNYFHWQSCLGVASGAFIMRDLIMMENQIPFQVLKLLISLKYTKKEAENFLEKFFSVILRIELKQAIIPEGLEGPPLHFLEALWRVTTTEHINQHGQRERVQLAFKSPSTPLFLRKVKQLASKCRWPSLLLRKVNQLASKFQRPRSSIRNEKTAETDISKYRHRSVVDLKAKGIHFRPCSSPPLRNIKFTSGAFYGKIQLPVRSVSALSHALFSNMIAYEVLPNHDINLVVLSYVIFMKSLIQSPDDVKELQEQGILLNRFANLEKVVTLFKEIDTFGLHDEDIFKDVKQKVEEHCNSKAKTWIADLIHTQFRTPWTAIAFIAAVFLLCLTFLQTFFTIRPVQ